MNGEAFDIFSVKGLVIAAIVIISLLKAARDATRKGKADTARRQHQQQWHNPQSPAPRANQSRPLSDIEQWLHSLDSRQPADIKHPPISDDSPAWSHEGESSIASATFATQAQADIKPIEPIATEPNPLVPSSNEDWQRAIIANEILTPKF